MSRSCGRYTAHRHHGLPLHLKIIAEAFLQRVFSASSQQSSPYRSRQGPFIASLVVPSRVPPSPPSLVDQRRAIRSMRTTAIFPTPSRVPLSDDPHSSLLDRIVAVVRRVAPSICMAWSCHAARVKSIGAARDLPTLLHDESDSPSHPSICHRHSFESFYQSSASSVATPFPIMSFIRRSWPSLFRHFVVVVGHLFGL